MIHHLTDRDEVEKTASCSVCGPSVRIGRTGNGWACSTKLREHRRRWRRRHPDRVRMGRSTNPHALVSRRVEDRSGVCPICGPVAIVPWARGWICATRSRELGRTVAQDQPLGYCRDCQVADGVLVWLTDGECLRCAETDLGVELAKVAADERLVAELDEWGMGLVGAGDPYAMPDYESAVPGWKTLG